MQFPLMWFGGCELGKIVVIPFMRNGLRGMRVVPLSGEVLHTSILMLPIVLN